MSENHNGATVIMLIRHAEKPHTYNGQTYDGVNATGTVCGKDAAEHLVTLGWERTGGLVSLFSAPWGPKEGLSTPQFLYAADPNSKSEAADSESGSTGEGPSQRPPSPPPGLPASRISPLYPIFLIPSRFTTSVWEEFWSRRLFADGNRIWVERRQS